MRDFPPSNLRQRLIRRAIYGLPYLLLLYILSVGPMYWQIREAYQLNGSRFLFCLYYPLVLACEVEYVSNFFDWYIGLWI